MQDLVTRTRSFALRIVKLFSALLLRCGTSVGAHYREGMRARSKAEFIAKIDAGLQELEESLYWLELLLHSEIMSEMQLSGLMKEAGELTAILITVSKNTKSQL